MKRVLQVLLIAGIVFFILSLSMIVVANSSSDILYYEYGSSKCPHCVPMHEFLQENYPNGHYFCDISSSPQCAEYFTEYLKATGLPGYVPQTIVVKNMSYVLAIVIGEVRDKEFLDSLANLSPSTEIPVYEGETLVGHLKLKNMTVHRYLVSLLYLPGTSPATTGQTNTPLQNHTVSSGGVGDKESLLNPVAYLVPLALSDSINPCTIAIYTVLLATVSIISRRKAVAVGLLFIGGVFIGYTALGVAISYGLSFIDIPQEVLAFILIGFGLVLVLSTFRAESECRVCREGVCAERNRRYDFLYRVLRRAETTMVFALLLGLLVSVTLLPCSMGPYIVFLITLRKAGVSPIPYILLYNTIFAVPLYVVLISLVFCKKYVNIEKYRYWIYLVAGMILVILGAVYFIS